MPQLLIAAQLYTLRDLTRGDFTGTLRAVRDIGYTAVELAGYGDLTSAKEVRQQLDDLGLNLAGAHVAIDALETDLSKVLDEQEVLGNRNVVCPYLPDTRRTDANAWRQVARSLNAVGHECNQRGFNLAYHNHSFEFHGLNDAGEETTGMNLLWENTDLNLVRAELDVYWVQHAGLDPAKYIAALGHRVQLIHLKDMARDENRSFAPVGEGILCFNDIFAAAESVGAEWGIVEQDTTYQVSPLDALRTSYKNLRAMGAV